jgi:transposase
LGRISIVEVAMRPPEVFVRPLSHEEALRLKRLVKRSKHASTRERASIVLGSNAGVPAAAIAASWLTDDNHVRKVIHEFNERGFDSLRPNYRGGRSRRIERDDRQRIVAIAGARPDTQRVALTRWSLPRLAAHLAERQIAQVSPAHLGRLLAEANLSFQRTRTWKASPDPDYEAKAARVLALRRECPVDGVVIAFDQMGPVSLRPTAGGGWALKGRPERQRADYGCRSYVKTFSLVALIGDGWLAEADHAARGADDLEAVRGLRRDGGPGSWGSGCWRGVEELPDAAGEVAFEAAECFFA